MCLCACGSTQMSGRYAIFYSVPFNFYLYGKLSPHRNVDWYKWVVYHGKRQTINVVRLVKIVLVFYYCAHAFLNVSFNSRTDDWCYRRARGGLFQLRAFCLFRWYEIVDPVEFIRPPSLNHLLDESLVYLFLKCNSGERTLVVRELNLNLNSFVWISWESKGKAVWGSFLGEW